MRTFFTLLASMAIVAIALPVAGCADKQVSNFICTHQISLGALAVATINDNTGENPRIKNAKDRQLAIDGANVTLGLISKCDPATPQVPIGEPSAPVAPPG